MLYAFVDGPLPLAQVQRVREKALQLFARAYHRPKQELMEPWPRSSNPRCWPMGSVRDIAAI